MYFVIYNMLPFIINGISENMRERTDQTPNPLSDCMSSIAAPERKKAKTGNGTGTHKVGAWSGSQRTPAGK